MARLLVVHWKPDEAVEGIALLEKAGHSVEVYATQGGVGLAEFRESPPEALVISLERLPSHGREVARWFRSTKATATVPIVFVGGAEDKVKATRSFLPDAVFSAWRGVRGAVKQALDMPQVAQPIAACSTKPLWQKLEMREGDAVLQLGGPKDLRPILGEGLPGGISILRRTAAAPQAPKGTDLVLLFAMGMQDLEQWFDLAADATPAKRPLWLCWPKKTSGLATDLTQAGVMTYAKQRGWTDTKICRVDETWSGHMFRRKR